MSFFQYIQDVPNASNNPSDDQPDMLVNTNSAYGIIAVDHVGYNENSATRKGGYHTVIHQGPQTVDPATIANFGQTYTKSVGAPLDQQLFFKSGLGKITQITGPVQPSSGTNGYTVLPGGLIMQWGIFNAPGTGLVSGSLLFATSNINFPNNVFNLQITPTGNSSSAQTIQATVLNTTGFTWTFTTASNNSYNGFFWMAIGN